MRSTDAATGALSRLLVTFENGVRKLYDCSPLFVTDDFLPLRQGWLFRSVQADSGGYGVSWGDELDLSEADLWENGRLVDALESVDS